MIDVPIDATILVIDDEPDNLRLALEMLRGHGLEIASARDGAAGLRIAQRLRPDLILLDICMPCLGGFQVCRQLKADPATRDCPVIFLTALDRIEDKAQGFAAGAVDYITKPFDARELLLRVANHLRLARRIAATQSGHLRPPPEAPAAPPDRPLATLLKARNLLLSDLRAPPDLDTLASHCATNRTSLQRLFRAHFGLSVFSYLREQRLQHGQRLLEQGGQRVDTVAEAVGYTNGRDFARAFKQRFGVAPGAWPGHADPIAS
ncbi:response regulator [uncultured Thiodictyon sp.]|uniref:response regulator transcription factor n=1 Tax=uncultured Thiodictyon sp. TaxID=1846217 RepID=UPI0025E5F94C|nr:response regulator [uncultured Thiodictyon sp.]